MSTSSTKFVFFGPIGKTRWPPWPLIGWDIFDFSSETAEWNSTKLDRKQDLNVLYQFCVFRADLKNEMVALASDWLRHFRLLLWTELKETWQEAISQRPLPSLYFSGRSVNKNGRPGLRFLKKLAHCTQVHDVWPFGPLVTIITCTLNVYSIFAGEGSSIQNLPVPNGQFVGTARTLASEATQTGRTPQGSLPMPIGY